MTHQPATSPGLHRNALLAVVIGLGLVSAGSAYQVVKYYGRGVNAWDLVFLVSVAAFLVLLLRVIGSLAATHVLSSRRGHARVHSERGHERRDPPGAE